MMIAKSSASVWLMRVSARGLWDSRPSQVSCYGGFGLCVRLVMEAQMGRHKRLQWSQGRPDPLCSKLPLPHDDKREHRGCVSGGS